MKLRPLISVTYTRTWGGNGDGYGDDSSPTIIKASDANVIAPMAGLRLNGLGEDPVNGISLSLILSAGYKIAIGDHPKAFRNSGPELPGKVAKVQKYIDNGFVASLGLVINLPEKWKHRKK